MNAGIMEIKMKKLNQILASGLCFIGLLASVNNASAYNNYQWGIGEYRNDNRVKPIKFEDVKEAVIYYAEVMVEGCFGN